MQFEDLDSWKKARTLTNQAYQLCKKSKLARDWGLRNQMQRAAISSMTNIAEGFDRTHRQEKLQFWKIAKASAGEVRSLLYIVLDNDLADPKETLKVQQTANETGALIQGLIRSFQRGEEGQNSQE